MKRIRSSLAWLLTATSLVAGISWRGDYDAAHREALKEHKLLAVLLVDAADPQSQVILRRLQDDASLAPFASRAVTVLLTRGVSRYPIELYYTTRFPALFVVDTHERFVCPPLYENAITPHALASCLASQLP